MNTARARERQIKGRSRVKKDTLITVMIAILVSVVIEFSMASFI